MVRHPGHSDESQDIQTHDNLLMTLVVGGGGFRAGVLVVSVALVLEGIIVI